MPSAIKGDHTILSTARPAEAAPTSRPRAGSAGPSSTPVRKTPSPRPTPSPTNLGMGGSGYTPRTKTPPPPPMMLSSRSSAAFNERERRSPKSSERHSPTQGKGASSPTETVGGVKPKDKGHIRSMSASTTPTPPPQPKELHSSGRLLVPRSKSQASDLQCSRVGTEARRPVARRPEMPAVETVDCACQTDGDDLGVDGALYDLEEDPDIPVLPEMAPSGTDHFLSSVNRMQAELEMALRTQMEDMAERPRVGPVTFSPMPPAPPTGSRNTSIARARSMGHLRPRPLGSRTSGGHSGRSGARDHEGSGSDGECHGEDDEVRSLSLSEDGPVIRRSVSESGAGEAERRADRHAAAAPDPIAMLTDGTRKVSARSAAEVELRNSGEGSVAAEIHVGSGDASRRASCSDDSPTQDELGAAPDVTDHEAGSQPGETAASHHSGPNDSEGLGSDRSAPHSAPNDSDHSMAPTARAGGSAEGSSSGVDFQNLLPVLSKVARKGGPLSPRDKEALRREEQLLEVVQEGPGVGADAKQSHRRLSHGIPRVPVRPSARRSSERNSVQALDLSQVTRLPPLAGAANGSSGSVAAEARPTSARSDVSFGSAHSAFSCWSSASASSSQLASPRPVPLKTTVSMPALTPHNNRR